MLIRQVWMPLHKVVELGQFILISVPHYWIVCLIKCEGLVCWIVCFESVRSKVILGGISIIVGYFNLSLLFWHFFCQKPPHILRHVDLQFILGGCVIILGVNEPLFLHLETVVAPVWTLLLTVVSFWILTRHRLCVFVCVNSHVYHLSWCMFQMLMYL